jgi:hypothetical protein
VSPERSVFGLKAKANERTEERLGGVSRWALRDIKGKRLKLTPVDPSDIRTLIDMGYVEMINDEPVVTATGLQQMEIGD